MILVGIAGGSGSGKTTFAEKICKKVALSSSANILHLHQDSYYLPSQPPEFFLKGKPNYDHPGAFDWPLLRSQLQSIKSGQHIEVPTYDFVTSSRLAVTVPTDAAHAVVFDGIYALWDEEVRKLMDLSIFLDVEADIRFIRRLHRDVKERGRTLDSIIAQYYDSVRPMHRQYLQPTAQNADLLVGEEHDVAAEVAANFILTRLNGTHA